MFARSLASLSLCPLVAERLLSGAQAPTSLHAAFPWLISASTSPTSFLTGYASLSNGVHLAQQRMFSSSQASGSSSQSQAAVQPSEAILVDESAVVVGASQMRLTKLNSGKVSHTVPQVYLWFHAHLS